MKYEVVIGLEVHANYPPNRKHPAAAVLPLCRSQHSMLPSMYWYAGCASHYEQKALEYTIRAGLALNCSIAKHTKWDRKNYLS